MTINMSVIESARFWSVCCLGVLVCTPAQAVVDDEFPNLDGSGDLMSTTAWGGPVSTNRININVEGTYFASTNGTLNGLRINKKNAAVTIDQTKSTETVPIITMGGPITPGDPSSTTVVEKRRIILKCGIYDFQGANAVSYGNYGMFRGNSYLFDGCVLTNVYAQAGGVLAFTHAGAVLTDVTFDNHAALYTTGAFRPDYGYGGLYNVTVKGGSKIVAEGGLVMGLGNPRTSAKSLEQKIFVQGSGTSLLIGSQGKMSWVGQRFADALLEVRDGASMTNRGSTFVIGSYEYATNCVVRASGMETSVFLGETTFGYNGPATDGRVEVLDGASAALGYLSFRSGERHGLIVSNATLSVSQYDQGANASNNYVRVAGSHPRVTLSSGGTKASFARQFRLIFDLPPCGYEYSEEEVCPIMSYASDNVLFDDTHKVEVNGIDAFLKGMAKRGIYKGRVKLVAIATKQYNGSFPPSLVEQWNEGLPENARLVAPETPSEFGDRRCVLYLDFNVNAGMVLIVK